MDILGRSYMCISLQGDNFEKKISTSSHTVLKQSVPLKGKLSFFVIVFFINDWLRSTVDNCCFGFLRISITLSTQKWKTLFGHVIKIG